MLVTKQGTIRQTCNSLIIKHFSSIFNYEINDKEG